MVEEANFKDGFPKRPPVLINPVVRNIKDPIISNLSEKDVGDKDNDRMCFRCEKMGHVAMNCAQSMSGLQ
ncbi:unnamed protein product [Gordionus sp. m RMFG-2023]